MPLTQRALDSIKRDSDLRAKLMLVDGKSEYTIKRWITDNEDYLTMPKYSSVIADHTGMKESEILESHQTA